jgi:hypothetical protein
MAARHWLALGMVVWAGAIAGQPPSPPPPPDAVRQPQPAAEEAGTADPDDGFIEFLGADDVGDPALWAFLKKSAQRKDSTPTPQPQDAKQ